MSESTESRLARIRFSTCVPGGDRIHYVSEEDVRVVLGRLPVELWRRLRAVHFNDRSKGARVLGYVTPNRHDIALCALPPRVSLAAGRTPERFGARNSVKWPRPAVRRYLLYDVLLHEIGHLQMIDESRPSLRLRFAHEKLANAFAIEWRRRFWSVPFAHPDPVHNPPGAEELENSPSPESLIATG